MVNRIQLTKQLGTLNDDCASTIAAIVGAMHADPKNHRPARPPFKLLTAAAPPQPRIPFIEKAKEPYFVCDRSGSATLISPATAAWFGATVDQLLGDAWHNYVDGRAELSAILEQWMVAAQTLSGFTHTVRCRKGNGQIAYVFVRVRPTYHPVSGEVEYFFGTIHPQVLPMRVSSQEATG